MPSRLEGSRRELPQASRPTPRFAHRASEKLKDNCGGRVIEVEGLTRGGQRYVSQVFVTATSGQPQSSIGVYWAGVGLDGSPLSEKNKVPQSECPTRKSTS